MKITLLLFCILGLFIASGNSATMRPKLYGDVVQTNYDVIRWINVAREAPKDMARIIQFLIDNYYEDGAIKMNGVPQPTSEEDRAYREAIDVLNNMTPVNMLWPNELLRQVAEGHNKDMIKNQFFNHTNLQGQNSFDRVSAKVTSPDSYQVRENLALAIDLEGPDFALMTVIKLLVDDGYKKNGKISRGHRENMLNPSITTVGTDIRRNENYYYYTTHLYSNENLNGANVDY